MNTDFYQITMAYAHFKRGTHEQLASFQLFYRKPPFDSQDVVACGLDTAIDFIQNFHFSREDLEYLESLQKFDSSFLSWLSNMCFTGEIQAVSEGTRVRHREPILRITAPMVQCQIFETPLLNIFNFQSLIATKAARVRQAAGDDPVIEFGLRRAQGFDGALSASKAAYMGGCSATSNLEAGHKFGIPVKGTMSHAWVMSFESEREAFEAYAQVFPESCVVAVDTYDTLQGVKNAILLGNRLRGIRLDSGDLAALSEDARRLLNQAGLAQVQILASGDLDEYQIANLKRKNAPIDSWGVGTRLVTAFDEPALTGVYKLARIQNLDGTWRDCHKTSNNAFKSSLPGLLPTSQALIPVFKSGKCVYKSPSIHEIRQRTFA